MVAVPGGTFTLGSPASETGRDADEGPQVEVTLKPFWIGKTEVTWDEFDQFAFVGNTGARTGDGGGGDADAVTKPSRAYGDEAKGYGKGKMPALAMTQHAAMEYCRWLSQVTGKAYRLPTEAEWEYAARAGDTGAHAGQPRRPRLALRQRQGDAAQGRREEAERVRPARHARQRRRVDLRPVLGDALRGVGPEGLAARGAADRQALPAPDARRVVHRGAGTAAATRTARRRTRTGASAIRRCRRASTGTPMPTTSASASSAPSRSRRT